MKPDYAPNVVNQTVSFGGKTWKGNPGQDWVEMGTSPSDILAAQKAATDAENARQEAKITDFLTRFKTAVGAQETVPAAAERIGGTLGLPQLQQTSQGLIKSVAEIPKVQTQATRGYDVNANQLARIIGAKQAELAPIAQQAVTQEQNAQSNLGTQLGYLNAQQQRELTPLTTEGGMLSDQIAREMSGFSQDKQNSLSLILEKMRNDQAITIQELNNANELAKAKAQYNDVYKTISEGSTLYNTQTGQPAYTAPKTYAPGSMNTWS